MIVEPSAFAAIAPEIFLLCAACLVLVLDVYLGAGNRMLAYRMANASLVITAILVLGAAPGGGEFVAFSGTFVNDSMSVILKFALIVIALFAFVYSRDYLIARDMLTGEFFILGLFAVLGMMVLVSAHSLLTVYLGLELLSLSLYAMVALNRTSSTSSEAAMKYFVLGALASGMLLYGMSMLYGATGTLDLSAIAQAATAKGTEDIVLVLGLVFVVVGVAFKLGAAPFHMWIPDVYEGAQTPVTMLIGTAPKIAAFAMLIRLLADGLGGLHADWGDMLVILAVLSIGLGNVIAIAQSNIKRMLAYSTIAHMGFLLLGVIPGTPESFAAAMFYSVVYAVMALGAFGIIMALSNAGFESDRLEDFKGIAKQQPWLAFLMLIIVLSMAGLPPFLGFWAKWSVLREVIAAGHVGLAIYAVLLSVVGLFYYLRVAKLMYFDDPEDRPVATPATDVTVLLSANSLAIVLFGLFPGALLAVCVSAFAG